MFDFDEIRPYNDVEAKEAYYRLTEDPRFQDAIAKFLPHYTAEDLRRDLSKFNTVDEIQADFIRRWIELFVRQFTSGCTMSGIENIDPAEKTDQDQHEEDDADTHQGIQARRLQPLTEVFGTAGKEEAKKRNK